MVMAVLKKDSLEHRTICALLSLDAVTYKELAIVLDESVDRLHRTIKSLRKKGFMIQTIGGGEGSRMEQERFIKYIGHMPQKHRRFV